MGLMKLLRQSVPSTVLRTILAHLCLFVFILGYAYMHEGSDDRLYADTVQTFMMLTKFSAFLVFGYFLEREMKKATKRYEAMASKAAAAREAQGAQAASDDGKEVLEAGPRPARVAEPSFISAAPDALHHETSMFQEAPDVRETSAMSFEPEELEERNERLVEMMESQFEAQANRTAEQMQLFP
jgi:hypothetical protein